MDEALFSALAERNRLRIIELLNLAPRPVGEVAARLGLRQPQATKHLQTLERAGLVTVHPLGQRRIYSLRREPFRELAGWLEAFAGSHSSEQALQRYAAAIAEESAQAARDPQWAVGRTLQLERELLAPAAEVWAHWTTAALVRRWWHPEHFEVVACELRAVDGGRIEITVQEGDGRQHRSRGRFLTVTPRRRLTFELSHLAADGEPLFTASHELQLKRHGVDTQLRLAVEVTAVRPTAATAIAGIEIGWEQQLAQLARMLAADAGSPVSP